MAGSQGKGPRAGWREWIYQRQVRGIFTFPSAWKFSTHFYRTQLKATSSGKASLISTAPWMLLSGGEVL
jgi:hypothetical protein